MRWVLVTAVLLLGLPAAAATPRVTDGDTIRIGDERIRLWGIDAPEIRQDCTMADGTINIGHAARNHLVALIGGRDVVCERLDVDRYGRTVARCSAGGLDLGALMVADGWAWDYAEYSRGAYADQQAAAEAAGSGLWAGGAVCELPAGWRREH